MPLQVGLKVPELPEVETVRRGLDSRLPGKRIVFVEVLRPDSIGHPTARQFCRLLPGHLFASVARRGKYLLASFDNGAGLAVHLRMSGRLLVAEPGTPAGSHLRVRMRLDDGLELRFEDMRVFGRLWYVPYGRAFEEVIPGLAELGPEPLAGFAGRHLKEAFRNRRQAVKSALLDQTLVSGIGNIYADESLFEAGIHPAKSACELKAAELNCLAEKIRLVLSRAIELGGSSIRDYRDSYGVNGSYQHQSLVYGRAGQPCRRCGRKVEKVKLSGRSTHFCPHCQPPGG